jgi:hypothetical protein
MSVYGKLAGGFLLVLGLSSCGYDGSYRYSCQDPKNWDSESCSPPRCLSDGNCTEILLGFDPTTAEIIAPETTEQTQETVAP